MKQIKARNEVQLCYVRQDMEMIKSIICKSCFLKANCYLVADGSPDWANRCTRQATRSPPHIGRGAPLSPLIFLLS